VSLVRAEHAAAVAPLLVDEGSVAFGKRQIWTQSLRSWAQWGASGIVAAVLEIAFLRGASISTATQVLAAVAFYFMLVLLVRLPVLVVFLLVRVAAAIVLLVLALVLALVGVAVRSDAIRGRIGPLLEVALEVIAGRRGLVGLREPLLGAGSEQHVGSLVGEASLVVSVCEGVRGKLRLCDAEVPPFVVTLTSGEPLEVVMGAGTLTLDAPLVAAREGSADEPAHPYFRRVARVHVPAGARIEIEGGVFTSVPSASALGGSTREPPSRRVLRGSPEAPLAVSIVTKNAEPSS
jgi:hypothetical protein